MRLVRAFTMRITAMNDIKNWIKKDEARKLKPYLDTVGKWTIGFGRNLSDNGLSPEECDFLFENDFKRCITELERLPWFNKQPYNVKGAIINMNFNLGIVRLLGFKKMISALNKMDYTTAAKEALNSKWASQVGNRAKEVAVMIRQKP